MAWNPFDHPGAPGSRGADSDPWNDGPARPPAGPGDLHPAVRQPGLGQGRHLDPPAAGPEPQHGAGRLRGHPPGRAGQLRAERPPAGPPRAQHRHHECPGLRGHGCGQPRLRLRPGGAPGRRAAGPLPLPLRQYRGHQAEGRLPGLHPRDRGRRPHRPGRVHHSPGAGHDRARQLRGPDLPGHRGRGAGAGAPPAREGEGGPGDCPGALGPGPPGRARGGRERRPTAGGPSARPRRDLHRPHPSGAADRAEGHSHRAGTELRPGPGGRGPGAAAGEGPLARGGQHRAAAPTRGRDGQ